MRTVTQTEQTSTPQPTMPFLSTSEVSEYWLLASIIRLLNNTPAIWNTDLLDLLKCLWLKRGRACGLMVHGRNIMIQRSDCIAFSHLENNYLSNYFRKCLRLHSVQSQKSEIFVDGKRPTFSVKNFLWRKCSLIFLHSPHPHQTFGSAWILPIL